MRNNCLIGLTLFFFFLKYKKLIPLIIYLNGIIYHNSYGNKKTMIY